MPGIPFYNDADADEEIPPYAVMRLTGSRRAENQLVLEMKKPNDEFQRLYYINDGVTVPAGGYGKCFTLLDDSHLIVPAYVETTSMSIGDGFGAKADEWFLQNIGYGFSAIGQGAAYVDVGIFAAFMRQGEVNIVEGVLDEDLTAPGTADLSVYAGASDTGLNLSVNSGLLADGDTIDSGTRMGCVWAGGLWVPWAREC